MLVVEVELGGQMLRWSEEAGNAIHWGVVGFICAEDTLVAVDNDGEVVEVEFGTGADSSSASTKYNFLITVFPQSSNLKGFF